MGRRHPRVRRKFEVNPTDLWESLWKPIIFTDKVEFPEIRRLKVVQPIDLSKSKNAAQVKQERGKTFYAKNKTSRARCMLGTPGLLH